MQPSIMITAPTRNDAHYLKRHLGTWDKVKYPRDRIRWVWMYGRSVDRTLQILEQFYSRRNWKAEIYPDPPFKNKTNNAIWIADVLNALRKKYKGEDFVVLNDSDIIRIPSNLLLKLVSLDLDIVAPYVWIYGTNPLLFFDTYLFRDLKGKKYPSKNVPYINSKKPIELSSVGSLLVIKGEIFKEIEFENPCGNFQFCKNARKKGYKVWGIPWVNIYHANTTRERREYHYPLEWFVKQGKLPKEILEKMK